VGAGRDAPATKRTLVPSGASFDLNAFWTKVSLIEMAKMSVTPWR
jgi:hypothetical protein